MSMRYGNRQRNDGLNSPNDAVQSSSSGRRLLSIDQVPRAKGLPMAALRSSSLQLYEGVSHRELLADNNHSNGSPPQIFLRQAMNLFHKMIFIEYSKYFQHFRFSQDYGSTVFGFDITSYISKWCGGKANRKLRAANGGTGSQDLSAIHCDCPVGQASAQIRFVGSRPIFAGGPSS
jgi:hypothetical protein